MSRRPRLRPDPGKHRSRRLSFSGWDAWEQLVLTYAGQASVCLIRPNVNALNVEIEYDRVVLHASVLEQDAETADDLEQIRAELEETLRLFVAPAPEVLLEIVVGIEGLEWDGFYHMSIYKVHRSTRED